MTYIMWIEPSPSNIGDKLENLKSVLFCGTSLLQNNHSWTELQTEWWQNQQTKGSNLTRSIDVTHCTGTQQQKTWVAYDNSTWHAINTGREHNKSTNNQTKAWPSHRNWQYLFQHNHETFDSSPVVLIVGREVHLKHLDWLLSLAEWCSADSFAKQLLSEQTKSLRITSPILFLLPQANWSKDHTHNAIIINLSGLLQTRSCIYLKNWSRSFVLLTILCLSIHDS